MTEEIRKRLEEAFIEWLNEHRDETTIRNYEDETLAHFSFNAGGEFMFKECGGMAVLHDMRKLILAQCKEWWKTYYKLPDYYHSETRDVQEKMEDDYEFHMKVVADFESDMNKLWEKQK